MKYISTRNKFNEVDIYDAIIKGLSDDGGLYIPKEFKQVNIMKLIEKSNKEILIDILEYFGFLKEDALKASNVYNNFKSKDFLNIKSFDKFSVIELFHGPTLAFKDYALTLLPKLLEISLNKKNISKIPLVCAATSGDTGSAALSGFSNIKKCKTIVFYPSEGISEIQEMQMKFFEGENAKLYKINGNFDNGQTFLKEMLSDNKFKNSIKEKYVLTVANSINIGRIIGQVNYYFVAYKKLVEGKKIIMGEKIDIRVPTGNFGNILAAYYAKKMGLPIDKLVACVNKNNVIYDFFNTGEYSIKRKFYKTIAPAMDILISSNLERFLYDIYKEDSKINALMKALKEEERYVCDLSIISKDISSIYASEDNIKKTIKEIFKNYQYLVDPHTATGMYKIKKSNSNHQVIISTASPYKFSDAILSSLEFKVPDLIEDRIKLVSKISNTDIPNNLVEIINLKLSKNEKFEIENIYKSILEFLEV